MDDLPVVVQLFVYTAISSVAIAVSICCAMMIAVLLEISKEKWWDGQ
jgi:hypothetical protein